jgi:hypothetical protein
MLLDRSLAQWLPRYLSAIYTPSDKWHVMIGQRRDRRCSNLHSDGSVDSSA